MRKSHSTYADKAQESKSQAIANSLPKQKSNNELAFKFVDSKTEAIAQRKLQQVINSSPQSQQLKVIQEMADTSQQVNHLRSYQAMADNYTSQAAQGTENSEHGTLQGKPETAQKKENNTGLPDNLKAGIENLSGYTMDDVKVHYNSDKPAQLQAHAYTQGTDIHLGPGQEKYMSHEAWHVVQQKQGRVKPMVQLKSGLTVNEDDGLEKEASAMGEKVLAGDNEQLAQQYAFQDNSKHNPLPSNHFIQRKSNTNAPIQRLKKHFSTLGDRNEVVMRYKETVAEIVSSIESRVEQARGIALNWNALDFNDRGHLGLWARTAKDYFDNPRKTPDFIHARFGYAIETIACANIPGQFNGLSIDFQVSVGNTRPDIVLTSLENNSTIAWIDITSKDSENHILGKDGAGWRTKPFVFEVFYEPLRLPEILTGLEDPVYRAWGDYLSTKNQIVHEEQQKERTDLRNKLLELQENNKWQTGYGDANEKRKSTKKMLEGLGMELGRSSQKATRGALALVEINDGPFGFNRGKISRDTKAAKKFIHDKAEPTIKERQGEIETNYLEYYQDIIVTYQDLPLVNSFYKYLLNGNEDSIEVGTAVAASVQVYESLNEAQESLSNSQDIRMAILKQEMEQHSNQLPDVLNFKVLQDWSNKAAALLNKMRYLDAVIREQQLFLNYLTLKYKGSFNSFFSRTPRENKLVFLLSSTPQSIGNAEEIVSNARQYRDQNPLG